MSVAEATKIGRLPSSVGLLSRFAYAHAKKIGVAPESLLRKAGLTLQQIENPDARINVRDQIAFLNLIATAVDDDLLGFHLARQLDLRVTSFLYYIFASADTLIDGLQRISRYSSIANEGIALKCVDETRVVLSLRYSGVSRHLDQHQMEFWVTIILRMCRELAGIHLIPDRMQMIHSRTRKYPELVEFFGKNLEFAASVDGIELSNDARRLPIQSADPHLNKLLISYCEEALSHRPNRRSSFGSNVENAIVPLLPHGTIRAAEIARQLGVSQRTFARRLSSEGLTFSELLESLRSELANRYLADRDLRISQVAWLLGYREVGAFSHAFKRWTGMTPRQARSQQ